MTRFIRRLQRIGSSMLVSLPKEWVDANGLGRGSQVEVETGQHGVTVSAIKDSRPVKELKISYPLPKEENIAANLTGAYLLGFDMIQITSGTTIPAEDREKIRDSMRRLVGMEIIEEDASNVSMQFLLDAAALDPGRILRRMSSIALGMYHDAVDGLISDDRSDLRTIPRRDVEVNRQYFLLVRLIRGALADRRLAGAFDLESIDILDYRIAAGLLENAGDSIVVLSDFLYGSSLPMTHSKRIHRIVRNFGRLAERSIDAFTRSDRLLAIEAIALQRGFEGELAVLKTYLGGKSPTPIESLDLVYMFERIARYWADMADLVKPLYRE